MANKSDRDNILQSVINKRPDAAERKVWLLFKVAHTRVGSAGSQPRANIKGGCQKGSLPQKVGTNKNISRFYPKLASKTTS